MKTRTGQKRQGKRKKVQAKRQEVPEVPEEREDPWPHLQAGSRGRFRRQPRVPPPESEAWPPEYRGKRWRRAYATLFAGKCLLCQYSCPQPASRRMRDRWLRQDTPLFCTNHPRHPGELIEVLRTDTCRNFKTRHCVPRRTTSTGSDRPLPKRQKGVRRIPVGRDLFATVDAADFKEISKHKWSVSRVGKNVYAYTTINGRTVLMHRFLLRPRKGYQVDHIDGNGLNNCRRNLRVCTQAQNQVNQGPRGGSSRFVGVCRRGDLWEAWINHHRKWQTLGRYADEVEAAKARDRKAVELHGRFAYLNFPEDWTFDKNGVGHPVRPRRKTKEPARRR